MGGWMAGTEWHSLGVCTRLKCPVEISKHPGQYAMLLLQQLIHTFVAVRWVGEQGMLS